MSVSEQLKRGAGGLWEANFNHPFVRGIGDGTLAEEKFRFYLAQDYVYLVDLARFFALAVAKGADLEVMEKFSSFVEITLKTEMELHRSICADFGITASELEATQQAPTCLGYTSFLLRVAYEGDLTDIAAVLLPCEWGYVDIGVRLRERGLPDHKHYAKWIETYSSEEFRQLVDWSRELLEQLACGAGESRVARLQRMFSQALGWEYLFWQMSWNMEGWPR